MTKNNGISVCDYCGVYQYTYFMNFGNHTARCCFRCKCIHETYNHEERRCKLCPKDVVRHIPEVGDLVVSRVTNTPYLCHSVDEEWIHLYDVKKLGKKVKVKIGINLPTNLRLIARNVITKGKEQIKKWAGYEGRAVESMDGVTYFHPIKIEQVSKKKFNMVLNRISGRVERYSNIKLKKVRRILRQWDSLGMRVCELDSLNWR